MNDLITDGAEIKIRIISEMQKAKHNIYIAMAWFTDRDIVNALIAAKNRNVNIEIILSSSDQNETVIQMFVDSNIKVHAFEMIAERGIMHHKFCLIDNGLSISGSYNYTYNASTNNVENILISNDFNTYRQFLAEFEKLKNNIEQYTKMNIERNNPSEPVTEKTRDIQQLHNADSFTQQLSNLIYTTANINTDNYRKQGYDNSKDSQGSIEIFSVKYFEIKEQIRTYATDDSLNSRKSVITQNINSAFENKKAELEKFKQNEIRSIKSNYDIELRQLNSEIKEINENKSLLETGNTNSGEKGLLQINKNIESNRLQKNSLESTLVVKKFWTVGTKIKIIIGGILIFYLSIFFASAMYKVFFEENIIQNALQSNFKPMADPIVDANAIWKIFKTQGTLFGVMALFFFLIPVLLSNLKLLGSKKEWVNKMSFWIGILAFDIVVSIMVAMNKNRIDILLGKQDDVLKISQVPSQGEFWLIFVFGMLPLIVTHYMIEGIAKSYQDSQREVVDAEKNQQILIADNIELDLMLQKGLLQNKIKEMDDLLKLKNIELQRMELEINTGENHIENTFLDLLKNVKDIYDDITTRVSSGRIFTDEILNSISTAYKSGYIEYLPELYAEREVANRVRQIELVIKTN
jgi:hypothetical protein